MTIRSGYINDGVNNSPNGWSEGGSWSYFTMPQARLTSAGNRRILITAMGLYLAGRGANRSANLYIADADGSNYSPSANFTIPSAGSGQYVSAGIAMYGFANFQQARAGYTNVSPGAFNIGARAGGTIFNEFGNFGDRSLTGFINWAEAPAAPVMLVPEVHSGGEVTVRFDGTNTDDGGLPITGWILQWSKSPTFATGVSWSYSSGTTVLQLEPGETYYFRATGQNQVVNPYGEGGVFSNVRSSVMTSGGKIRRSGAWVDAQPKIRDAGIWKDARVKVRDNGLWVPAQ